MEASNISSNNKNLNNLALGQHASVTAEEQEEEQSQTTRDEVDFVAVAKHNNNNNNNNNIDPKLMGNTEEGQKMEKSYNKNKLFSRNKHAAKDVIKNQQESKHKENKQFFSFGKSKGQKLKASMEQQQQQQQQQKDNDKLQPNNETKDSAAVAATPAKTHKFVKSSSITRLLSGGHNTYNAKKFEKEEKKLMAKDTKYHTYGGRRRGNGPYLERFKQRSAKEEGDVASTQGGLSGVTGPITLTTDSRDLYGGSRNELASVEDFLGERNEDLGAKAFRTLSRGIGKLLRKRTHSVEISTPDPEFKVSYLGNVLTGWAKGELNIIIFKIKIVKTKKLRYNERIT